MSLDDLHLAVQAAMSDGVAFDLLPFSQDLVISAEVGITQVGT